jgi:co-chaperonin GroES (HSP10)
MAYQLLLAYAFVLQGSSKIAHTRIGNIGPTTIRFRNNNDQLLPLHDRVVIERNDTDSKTFPTPPRRSRSRARSSPLDPAARDETGKLIPIDVRVGDRVLLGEAGHRGQDRWRRVPYHERE